MDIIYTIGHSTQTVDAFIEKLKEHSITCIADVRSIPYSRYASDYNMENIKFRLKENDITYVHLGEEFGARRTDKSLYDEDGKLNFERTVETDSFKEGINRLRAGLSKGYNIALMCSEKNPEECHRCIMVGHELSKQGFDVENILEDGTLMSQQKVDELLVNTYAEKILQVSIEDMIATSAGQSDVDKAYAIRAKEIAYKLEDI